MKKAIPLTLIGILLAAQALYAVDGDLIVDGKEGLGTATPLYKLDIRTPGSTAGQLHIASGDTDSGGYIGSASAANFFFSGGALWNGTVWVARHTGAGAFRVGSAGDLMFDSTPSLVVGNTFTPIERMRIVNSTGNVGIGTSSPGTYKLYVQGTAYSTGGWQPSDLSLKDDIAPIDAPLQKLLRIQGATFRWKTEELKGKGYPEGRHHGVIAQQIEEVLPEIVKEGPEGEKAVAYTELIPVLIEAIKEQQKQIETLVKEISQLKASR